MEQTSPLPDDGLVGRMLGPYRVLSRLGKGGMGEVFVAEDTKLERRVALKTLPPDLATDPERRTRFERESKAIAALNHPNIVTIHAFGEADGLHFIAMELIEGQTLSQIIPEHGLPLGKLFELAIPLVDAVAAAHQQGITHRDLKPDNVMLGADGRLKVLDFGLARRERPLESAGASTGTATASLTQDGRIVGTVSYMSPEQSEGRPVDTRSDIFSLGVMFYEMATGQRPFQGDTSISIMASILKDNPLSVTEVKANLPNHLGRIVRRCLHKDPARRYQSAVELRNELQDLKGEVETGETRPVKRSATPVWRRPGVLAAAVAVVALVLLVADQLRRPRDEPRVATPVAGGLDVADAHATLGEFPDALKIYRELAASEDRAIAAAAAERLRAVETRLRPDYDKLVDEGRAAFERREYPRAAQALRRAVGLLPAESVGQYWLARSLAAQGKRSEALEAMGLAVAGGGTTRAWFEDREFVPLYRDAKFRGLMTEALGPEATREIVEAATSRPAPAAAPAAPPSAVASAAATTAAPARPRFIHGLDGTLTDDETGLVWGAARAAPQWKDAEAWCGDYRGAGTRDWRMPTLEEVASLCGAGDAGVAPPRHVWAAERQDKQFALFNCAENRLEGWWTTADAKKAKKDGGIEPQALPVRKR